MRVDEPNSNEEPESRSADDSGPEDLPDVNELLDTLFTDRSLWPLLTVFGISLGALGAAALVLALGDRNVFAAGALLLLAGMTIDVCLRARRRPSYRVLAKAILLLWTSATVLALIAVYSGIT
jgi:pimeloyl-ACP methyl ester carboxylesterase